MKYAPVAFKEILAQNVYIHIHKVYKYNASFYLREFNITDRHHSCFAYLAEGEYQYTTERSTVTYHGGSLLYLPKGSKYHYQVLSDRISVFQIEFDFISTENQQRLSTGTEPVLISPKPEEEIVNLVQSVCSQALLPNPSAKLEATGNLYHLLASILQEKDERNSAHDKMSMIVNYLNHNYMNHIQIQQLPAMCALSEAQFYRLFKQATGLTPHQYVNLLKTNMACKLLRSTEMKISEISDLLGFDNVFSFSQAFKRAKKLSPNQYRQNKRE